MTVGTIGSVSASVAAFFAAFVVVVVDSLSFLEPLVNPPFGETLPPFAGLLFGLMVVGEKLFVRLFSLLPEPVGDVNFCDDFEDELSLSSVLSEVSAAAADAVVAVLSVSLALPDRPLPELDFEAEPV